MNNYNRLISKEAGVNEDVLHVFRKYIDEGVISGNGLFLTVQWDEMSCAENVEFGGLPEDVIHGRLDLGEFNNLVLKS